MPPNRPRFPLSWSDWSSGEWLGVGPLASMVGDVAGSLETFARLVGAPIAAAVDRGPMAPHLLVEQLLELVRSRLLGRELALQAGGPNGAELRLVPTALRLDSPPVALALGQLGDVDVEATDVHWPQGRLQHLRVRFGNVHVRPGIPPTLVAAPVRIRATLGQAEVDELVAGLDHRLRVELRADRTAWVTMVGRERWGTASVRPRLEGDRVRLVPTSIEVRSRRIGLPERTPAPSVPVPPLPPGMVLIGLELGDAAVHADALLPEWRQYLSATDLQHIDRALRAGSTRVDLPAARSDRTDRTDRTEGSDGP